MQKRLESLRVGPPGLVRVSSLVRWLASLQAQLLRVQGAAGPVAMGAGGMAKAKSKQVVLRLMSQAGTGYYYTFRTTLKGVREKCAHRHRSRLLHYPCHLHHRLFVSSALGRPTASCTNATTTLRRYRHIPCHRYRHPHPPPAPPPSPPPIASATIAACALATTAATAALATTAHSPTTVPTEPYPYRPTAPHGHTATRSVLRRLLLMRRGPRAGYSS